MNRVHKTRYDELDRLVSAQVKGTFLDDISSRAGYVTGDFTGGKALNFSLDQSAPAAFDYAAASVGLDVSSRTGAVRSLYLAKDDPAADTSRITQNTFDLYASTDGWNNI